MNKIKFALKNGTILALLITSFIACDKDFATVGSDIIGENNFESESTKEYSVVAYTNPLEAVQTNNLTRNFLGAYNDPLYGLTTASFVSQLAMSAYDPDFGDGIKMDSVVLTVPYFSTRVETNSEGETIYKLDSVFGDGFVDMAVYENKYFLNSIDPNENLGTPLKYFSNSTTTNGSINQSLLEGEPIPVASSSVGPTNIISNFKPSNKEIQLWDADDEITERLAPAMRIKMDTLYWREKIINKQDAIEISNTNNFINYYRGIYLKTTPISGSGSLAMLNFTAPGANITIYYTKNPIAEGAERSPSTFVLRFSGNRVNFLDNQFNFAIPQGDAVNGDEKLYLKGAGGSNAVIDLFKSGSYEDGVSPEFIDFKNDFVFTDENNKFLKSKRLVNEANLVFYVDQSSVIGNEPDRLYLYDLTNAIKLRDYDLDFPNNNVPIFSRINHLGILQREGDTPSGEGIKYKMKITEHINNLLLLDSTNVKLGLAVSTNINIEEIEQQASLKTTGDDIVQKVPESSILSPKGTVLFGNNTSNTDKRLYLEIFYTEPNN